MSLKRSHASISVPVAIEHNFEDLTWISPKRRKLDPSSIIDGQPLPTDEEETTQTPLAISFENILAASKRIETGIVKTACRLARGLNKLLGLNLYLKVDYLQLTGSFKVSPFDHFITCRPFIDSQKERGALNALLQLSTDAKRRGVIAASAGNHALALAYHGGRLNIPVTVVMPKIAPLTKVHNCRDLGATVVLAGEQFAEAQDYAKRLAVEKSLTYVHGFDHPAVIAGQGSLGLEILEQVPNVDVVIVPVGGGGLLAGLSMAIKSMRPEVEIIGVEPRSYAGLAMSLKAGKPVEVAGHPTIADGLAVRRVGDNVYPICERYVDRICVVDEHDIALAVLRLIEKEKIVVEGAGAAALAPILANQLPDLKGKTVVLCLCGGNIDVTLLGRVIDYGLAADGRLVRFRCLISDRPGGLARFCSVIADVQASIKETVHDRAFTGDEFSMVQVEVTVETRDAEHREALRNALISAGYEPEFYHFFGKRNRGPDHPDHPQPASRSSSKPSTPAGQAPPNPFAATTTATASDSK